MCFMFIITKAQLQIDSWIQMVVLMSQWQGHQDCDSWHDDRDTLTHTSHSDEMSDVPCSHVCVVTCDAAPAGCVHFTLYSTVLSTQDHDPRSTLNSSSRGGLGPSVLDTAGRDHLPGPGLLTLTTLLPKLFRGYTSQHSSPFSHYIKGPEELWLIRVARILMQLLNPTSACLMMSPIHW